MARHPQGEGDDGRRQPFPGGDDPIADSGRAITDVADPDDEPAELIDDGGDLGSRADIRWRDLSQHRDVAVQNTVDRGLQRLLVCRRTIGKGHQFIGDSAEGGDNDDEGPVGAFGGDDGCHLLDPACIGDGAASEFENPHDQLACLRWKLVARFLNPRTCSSSSAVSMRKASWPCGERSHASSASGTRSAISSCSTGG